MDRTWSIDGIIEHVTGTTDPALLDVGDAERVARGCFRRLWKLDVIAIGINGEN